MQGCNNIITAIFTFISAQLPRKQRTKSLNKHLEQEASSNKLFCHFFISRAMANISFLLFVACDIHCNRPQTSQSKIGTFETPVFNDEESDRLFIHVIDHNYDNLGIIFQQLLSYVHKTP